MDIGMRSLHPAAADHSVSIRDSRCTALIMFSLRSRAGDPAAQRWYSNCGDGTWRLRSLLQGTRVTYVTETFPFSRSLRVTSDDRRIGIPTKAPQELPLPAPCVDLLILPIRQTIGPGYTEKVDYCCPLSNPNSRTWITLGKCTLPLGRGTLRSHLLPEGVKWHYSREVTP